MTDAGGSDDRTGYSAGSQEVPTRVVATTDILLERRIGRGGLGDVYVARDRGTGRSLAVKFLSVEAAAQESCRRDFQVETRVTSQLEHPNIVPVYASGESTSGRPYYAMRLIQGRTLAESIAAYHAPHAAGEASSEERSARLSEMLSQFALVCKAIAYGHDRGVIHRDIKPANIMLGRFGEVVVLDWGLAARVDRGERARLSGEESILMPTLSIDDVPADARPRTISGTPAYMSPEQHDGGLPIGPASDVYGLGATLYQILTGQPPYDGDTAAIRDHVLEGRLVSPTRINRRLSPAIAAVCMKAMAHDPADRYESPLELAHDVEHYLADLPVSAYREPLRRRLARWARRHRTIAQLGLVSLIATLLVVATSAVLLRRLATDEYRARQTALVMAARLAASTAALEIDIRWRILEHEAENPSLVSALVAYEATADEARQVGSPFQKAIQTVIDRLERTHREAIAAESWFVCDARGVQVARSPTSATIGQSFSFRNYFHGGEADLPVGTPAEPLSRPHRSSVYKSHSTGRLKVAFSVPIWSDPEEADDRRRLGVLVMTFDVGMLFRSIDAIAGWNALRRPFSVAVIDLRDDRLDGEPRPGLVLENPELTTDVETLSPTTQTVRANPSIVARLRMASQDRQQDSPLLTIDSEGPTITAAEPIVIPGRSGSLGDVDWAVLVEER
jgi:serine/threonine protein kinase